MKTTYASYIHIQLNLVFRTQTNSSVFSLIYYRLFRTPAILNCFSFPLSLRNSGVHLYVLIQPIFKHDKNLSFKLVALSKELTKYFPSISSPVKESNVKVVLYCSASLRPLFFIHHSGIRMVGTECIRSIRLFILPLGVEWMEWHSVHSGIGMRNRKTRAFCILATLIPE